MAASGLPPVPTMPTAANCDAPVNTRSDSAHVLATDRPLATASTPNDTPKTPTAAPSVIEAATGDRGAAVTGRLRSRAGGAQPEHAEGRQGDEGRCRLAVLGLAVGGPHAAHAAEA